MRIIPLGSDEGSAALAQLLDAGPVLLELRFPHVSSDWCIAHDIEDVLQAIKSVRPGTPIFAWSLLDIPFKVEPALTLCV